MVLKWYFSHENAILQKNNLEHGGIIMRISLFKSLFFKNENKMRY